MYTAVLLDTLGIDRAALAPTFAVGRVAGLWPADPSGLALHRAGFGVSRSIRRGP
ncbi:MAG: hypothetical protein IPO88_20215 [Nannocystis sp.]|nr:hypothetical protein [Nannocystis sp.]